MDRVDELREKLPVECEFPEGCQDLLDDLLELARIQKADDLRAAAAWDAVIRRIGPERWRFRASADDRPRPGTSGSDGLPG